MGRRLDRSVYQADVIFVDKKKCGTGVRLYVCVCVCVGDFS